MTTKVDTLPSHDARKGWRKLTQNATKGTTTIITHYGDKVAALLPYEEYEAYEQWKAEREARSAS